MIANCRESRDIKIAEMYKSGVTMRKTGDIFGLTRQRVQQILIELGVATAEGGYSVVFNLKKKQRKRERDGDFLRRYGCPENEYLRIRRHKGKPTLKFLHQRAAAGHRRIEWKLTLYQWWQIWERSGKWDDRGVGKKGYCMSRFGDEGAYERGNVKIEKTAINSRDGQINRGKKSRLPSELRKVFLSAGGAAIVAEELGIKKEYAACICCEGTIPKTWVENGRIEKLAALTAGAYSIKEIIFLAVRPSQIFNL